MDRHSLRTRASLFPRLFVAGLAFLWPVAGLWAEERAGPLPVLLADLNSKPLLGPGRFPYTPPSQLAQIGERVIYVSESLDPARQCLLWSYSLRTQVVRRLASIERFDFPSTCFVSAGALGDSAFYLSPRHEIWRTDGTPAGTHPVTGLPTWWYLSPGTVVRDATGAQRLLFYACQGFYSCSLWSTDGTAGGTHSLSGDPEGSIDRTSPFVAWRGRTYFLGQSSRDGEGLYSTDGTAAGTLLVARVDSWDDLYPLLAATPSHLYFTSFGDGEELWVTDGTPESTRRLREFQSYGCVKYDCGQYLDALRVEGDEVAFAAHDGTHGVELWASDGSLAGTRRLTNLPDDLTLFSEGVRHIGERWLVTARARGAEGTEEATLWTTLGDPATTAPLLGPGWEGERPQIARLFAHDVQLEERLAFVGLDSAHGAELWTSDGTAGGTRRLTDVCPGPCSSFDSLYLYYPLWTTAKAGRLYFSPSPLESEGGGERAREEWSTDGTPEGTERFLPGSLDSLTPAGERLFGGSAGGTPPALRLWSTDGTASGTRLEAALLVGREENEGSYPDFIPAERGALILTWEGKPRRLLRTDGTATGTVPIPGPDEEPGFRPLWVTGRRCGRWTYLLRQLSSGATGEEPYLAELWRTDGSPGSTQRLLRFPPNQGFDLSVAAEWQGRCVFQGGGGERRGLWVSDGSAAGTRELFLFPPEIRFVTSILGVGPRFLFLAVAEGSGGLMPQLYSSAGTWGETRQLTSIEGARDPSFEQSLTRVGSRVFFLVPGRGFVGRELWITDGTRRGTRRIFPRLIGPAELTAFRGTLVFSAIPREISTCAKGLYRWSLGAAEPELLALSEAEPGRCASAYEPLEPIVAGNLLFFSALGPGGRELSVSDGSSAGTRRVRDLWPGRESSSPRRLTAAGSRAYFFAEDGVHGEELWTSDGTAGGTALVVDLNPGLRGSGVPSRPMPMTFSAGTLYFAADDGVHGPEPWALAVEP